MRSRPFRISRDKYRAAGIALEDLQGWDDFRRLPPLTRAEVNAHRAGAVFDRLHRAIAPARHGWIDRRPNPLLPDLRELRLAEAAKDRAYSWSGWRPRRAGAFTSGVRLSDRSRGDRHGKRGHTRRFSVT